MSASNFPISLYGDAAPFPEGVLDHLLTHNLAASYTKTVHLHYMQVNKRSLSADHELWKDLAVKIREKEDIVNILWIIGDDNMCTVDDQRMCQSILHELQVSSLIVARLVSSADSSHSLTPASLDEDVKVIETLTTNAEILCKLLEQKEMVWATQNAKSYVTTSKDLINKELLIINEHTSDSSSIISDSSSSNLHRFMAGDMFSCGPNASLKLALGFIKPLNSQMQTLIDEVCDDAFQRNRFRLSLDDSDYTADVHLHVAEYPKCGAKFYEQLMTPQALVHKKYVLIVLHADRDKQLSQVESALRAAGIAFEVVVVRPIPSAIKASFDCALRNARQECLTRRSTKNVFAAANAEVNERQLDEEIEQALVNIKTAKDL